MGTRDFRYSGLLRSQIVFQPKRLLPDDLQGLPRYFKAITLDNLMLLGAQRLLRAKRYQIQMNGRELLGRGRPGPAPVDQVISCLSRASIGVGLRPNSAGQIHLLKCKNDMLEVPPQQLLELPEVELTDVERVLIRPLISAFLVRRRDDQQTVVGEHALCLFHK